MSQSAGFIVLGILVAVCLLGVLGCGQLSKPAKAWVNSKILSENEDHPGAIVVDAEAAYFVTGGTVASKNAGTNNLKRVSLKDGSVSVLVKGGERIPDQVLAQDEQYIYWAGGGSISRVPKAGGESEIVVASAPMPSEIVVDKTHIYWIIWGGEGSPARPLMVAGKQPGSAAKPLTAPHFGANGLVLDETDVYWVTPSGIHKIAKTGGAETAIHTAPKNRGTSVLLLDADTFYFAQMSDRGSPALMSMPKKGGPAVQLAPTINWTAEMVVDSTHVYYFDAVKGEGSFGPGGIWKVPKAGGQPVMLDKGPLGWTGPIAQDANQLYFTTIDRIMALEKAAK